MDYQKIDIWIKKKRIFCMCISKFVCNIMHPNHTECQQNQGNKNVRYDSKMGTLCDYSYLDHWLVMLNSRPLAMASFVSTQTQVELENIHCTNPLSTIFAVKIKISSKQTVYPISSQSSKLYLSQKEHMDCIHTRRNPVPPIYFIWKDITSSFSIIVINMWWYF